MSREYPKLDKKYHEWTFPWKETVTTESKFPKINFKASPIKFYTPLSGCAVEGPFEIEIRYDRPKELSALAVSINGKETALTKPPYRVSCDASQYPRQLIRVDVKAKGGLLGRTIASNYTHYVSDNGTFNKDKILLLFGGPWEPYLEKADSPFWTKEQFSMSYLFSVCAMDHVFHYGLIPKFVGRFNFTTVLLDPTQMDQWEHEYKPNMLVDVQGRERSPLLKINYSKIPRKWVKPKYTPIGTLLPGYFKPAFPFFPNDMGDIYETTAARAATDYAEFKRNPVFLQARAFAGEVVQSLRSKGYENIACWDCYSLYYAVKPQTLRYLVKSYAEKEGITGVIMYDFLPDVSDFEDVKCLWEEIQDAIDFTRRETGRHLDLAVVQTPNGDYFGKRPEFAKATFHLLKNEIVSSGIPEDAPLAVILGEHGVPPGFAEHDTPHSYTMARIRDNVLNYLSQNIRQIRSGKTEFALSMNEFCNRPDDGHASTMERIYEFLEKGFKNIIICSYYFPFESNDLFRHLRHWGLHFEDWMNIPHEEVKALQKVLPNYRSEGTIRGARIIITGSVLGRYEKEPDNPLLKEANQYYVDAIADLIASKINTL
jgi:hypothetical protein